jgi:hypothetical protein
MVEKLRIAMGDEVEPYMVSTATIFEWLSDAYLRIQIEYDQWKFFHTRGLIFTTTAGVSEYALYDVKEISRDSVYCIKVGETTRYPMYFYDYDTWVLEEQINLQRVGDPRYLIKLPNDYYRVEPDPTEAWQIYGDVWYRPAGFSTLRDEPIWDEKYHSLVVWEALKVAALEWSDSKKLPRMQANLTANLTPMRRAFNYEYLRSKGGAEALL